MDLADAPPGVLIKRVSQKVFGERWEQSARIIFPDHLPPVAALDVAKGDLERIRRG
jgi:hypothetical protein